MLNRINPEASVVLPGRKLVYLLRDLFWSPVSAPLPASRSSEPGPGLMKKSTDPSNLGSISGREIVLSGKGLTNDPQYYWTRDDGSAFPRVQGRALMGRLRTDAQATGGFVGWTQVTAAGNPDAALSYSNNLVFREFVFGITNYSVGLMPYTGGADVLFALVMRSASADLFAVGGSLTKWTFLWRGVGGTPAYYPFLETVTSGGISYLSRLRVVDLPIPFTTDAGIIDLNIASPTTATNYSAASPDSFLELTVTSPAVLTGPMELNYRYVDDNNRWVAYFDSAGAFKADSIVNGVRTNQINVAGVATTNHTYTIRVRSLGTTHNFYTGDGGNFTRRQSQVDVATPMDAISTVRPVLAANWTMANLRSIQTQAAVYSLLAAR